MNNVMLKYAQEVGHIKLNKDNTISRKQHWTVKKQLEEREPERKSERDLQKLIGKRPSGSELYRRGVLGAGLGAALHPITTAIEGVSKGKSLPKKMFRGRSIGSRALGGAAFAAFTPAAKYYVDRHAALHGEWSK